MQGAILIIALNTCPAVYRGSYMLLIKLGKSDKMPG